MAKKDYKFEKALREWKQGDMSDEEIMEEFNIDKHTLRRRDKKKQQIYKFRPTVNDN